MSRAPDINAVHQAGARLHGLDGAAEEIVAPAERAEAREPSAAGEDLGVAGASTMAEPVAVRLDLAAIRNPPRETFLLGRMFPLGKPSVVFGPQGKGKSALLAQLLFALAAGAEKLWGLPLLAGGGPVLVYTAEDTLEDWQRKGGAILRAGGIDVERALERLWVVDRTEGLVRFTESVTVREGRFESVSRRESRPTEEREHLIALVKAKGARALLVETVSNLVDDEDNPTLSAFQGALRNIAVETGAAVIASHHATKAATRDNDSAVESARGGGALIANARNAVSLYPAEPSEAAPFRDRFPPEDLFVLTHGKATSSTRAEAPIVLVRCDAVHGAVFRLPDDVGHTPEEERKNMARLEAAHQRELEQLARLFGVVEHALPVRPAISPSWLRDHRARELDVGKHRVEALIQRALELGVLRVHKRTDRGITVTLGVDPRTPADRASPGESTESAA